MTDEKKRRHIWVTPCTSCGCGCEDDDDIDRYEITFEIPGVQKKDIHMHVVKEGLRLSAPRGDDILYVSEYQFLCPVDEEQVTANYENGLLTLLAPYSCPDSFKESKPIEIA